MGHELTGLDLAAPDLQVGVDVIEWRLEQFRCAKHNRNRRQHGFHLRADDLNVGVGEAQRRRTAQILLQAGTGDADAFELEIGAEITLCLIAVHRHERIDQRLEGHLGGRQCDLVLVAGHGEIKIDRRIDRRAVECKLAWLDDDVAAAIERLRRVRDAKLRDIVNDALRKGLRDMTARPKQREPFQTQIVALGRVRLASIDNISESLAVAEGEAFK